MLVINDFGHEFLSRKIIRLLSSKARYIALNVQANSANFGFNIITKYPRADYVCIDEQELRLATHDRHSNLATLVKKVSRRLGCRDMIVTRGPHGAMYYAKTRGFIEVPALTKSFIDRVGAGDALFAITAPCMYVKMDPELVSFIGNVAGALQVQTVGNSEPIDYRELTTYITRLLK